MHEVLRRFDRETGWLATGVLGSVVFAAILVAVQVREHQKDAINLPVEATQVGVDRPLISVPQTVEPATATPDLALNSDVSHQNVQANPSIFANQQTPAQVREPKVSIAKSKPTKPPRIVDVKKRLIELWHQSLARAETRGWTLFKSSNGRDKKKVSYTAETDQ